MLVSPSSLQQYTSGTCHKEYVFRAGSFEAGGIGILARLFERDCVSDRESDLERFDESQAEHA